MKSLVVVVALAQPALADPAHPKVTQIAIDYTYASFHSNELHYVVTAKPGGGFVVKGAPALSVDRKVIDDLYASLTALVPSDGAQRCISHTDDYPAFKIVITGDRPLELASDSNCHLNVPWNVTDGGKLLAQYNGNVGRAVRGLLAAVDPDNWKAPPDTPEAFTEGDGEIIELGAFTPNGPSTPAATACARTIETSAAIRAAFGEALHVTGLRLGCDLATSIDCKTDVAAADITWDGVEATLNFPCAVGRADVPAGLADIRKFLDSKPVRTLVRLSHDPPRLRTRDGSHWSLDGDGALPLLEYRSGRLLIDLHEMGEHVPNMTFWRAIGGDPSELTETKNGYTLTEATLDFAGHVVK